ncbi:pyridoxal phosphate-dependent aminotransferase [Alphaproteobacteria bacterium]|nr:pyridoxal phosphate-dependent aminotransferase [Alphaproteobacteria bacterium]
MTKATLPPFTPLVDSLPASVPFVGPEALERMHERAFLARIGANESVFGPSPLAIEAMQAEAKGVWQYGDPENFELKQALAKKHGISADHIAIGEGIDGLLGYLVRLFVEAGVHVVTTDGAYPTFNYHVTGFGGHLHKVSFKDDREDPAALLDKANEVGARIIYLSNPNNPMGSTNPARIIEDLADNLPPQTLLCLDEAYADFLDAAQMPDIAPDHPQIIRMRTFSKAYGMAGARIGYAITHTELATAFHKIRNHFGMSRISQAGALAALDDTGYLAAIRTKVGRALSDIAAIAVENGLAPLASATNFLAIDCGGDGRRAAKVMQSLISQGIFVRMPGTAPQNRCIRITAGTPEDCKHLAACLPKALAAAKQN